MKKWVAVIAMVMGGGFIGLLALAFVLPKRTLAQFERFVAAYRVGSKIEDLVADDFVRRARMIEFNEESKKIAVVTVSDESLARLQKTVRERPSGQLELMWYYLPPFGRLFLSVEYDQGIIIKATTQSLD